MRQMYFVFISENKKKSPKFPKNPIFIFSIFFFYDKQSKSVLYFLTCFKKTEKTPEIFKKKNE